MSPVSRSRLTAAVPFTDAKTMTKRFHDQVVVITGGGQGIGAASVRRFLDEGARVAVLDLDCDHLSAALPPGASCIAVSGDCTDAAVLASFFDRVESELGPVDVLFNNVGQSAREKSGPFSESDEATWRFVLEVSLMTTMRASRRVSAGMRDRGRGRIVNMSSDSAFVGDVGLADYAAAKLGVVGFTRSLARELAPHGVTVNVVVPGAIKTRAHDHLRPEILEGVKKSTPAGFIGTPDDVAGVVAFLASDEARFITGQSILIDGGRWMV